MYTIWRTGHPINEAVTLAVKAGAMRAARNEGGEGYPVKHVSMWHGSAEPSISYGILRGTAPIYHKSNEYWEIDRGYFRPDHYDGYYRISLNDMRAHYDEEVASKLPDRFNSLCLELKPWQRNDKGYLLVCPPSEATADFYGFNVEAWLEGTIKHLKSYSNRAIKVRKKNEMGVPLKQDLAHTWCLVTYNSNAAIDALLAGIPVISEAPDIKGWNPLIALHNVENYEALTGTDRYRLMNYLSWCQFTLDEFKRGDAWEFAQKIQKYKVC